MYRCWLLIPDGGPRSYRVQVLPSIPEGTPTLDYDIKSVFTADADGDGSPELCILSEIYKYGTGDKGKPFYDTDIFRLSGTAFTLMEQDVNWQLYGLRSAGAVRARLKKLLCQAIGRRNIGITAD